MLAPVALAQEMVKYALTFGRGSRYGCGGVTDGARAGSPGAILPTLPEAEWRGVDERETADTLWTDVGPEALADTGVPGAEGTVDVGRERGDGGKSDGEGEKAVLPADDRGRGLETDEDAPRPSMLLSRGGGGSIPATGAEEPGIGSTEDWRCKYMPSWTPFFRTTWT